MSENDINEVKANKNMLDNSQWKIDSSNIFDDFSNDSSLIEDIKKSKEKESKNWYYYLFLLWKTLKFLFVISLILSALGLAYIYVQKNDSITDSSILDPFCFAIKSSEITLPTTYCSSISNIKKYYDWELLKLKENQTKGVLSNLITLYENENFLNSKDITFLTNESKNRLNVVKVIEEFDSLKKAFLWLEKNKIQCSKWNIDANNKTFEISCNAYSQSYENNWIVWYSWDPTKKDDYVSGTSISIANSFLNYLEKNATSFTIADRQKLFESESLLNTSELWIAAWFTKKTSFSVKLKFNF